MRKLSVVTLDELEAVLARDTAATDMQAGDIGGTREPEFQKLSIFLVRVAAELCLICRKPQHG